MKQTSGQTMKPTKTDVFGCFQSRLEIAQFAISTTWQAEKFKYRAVANYSALDLVKEYFWKLQLNKLSCTV